MNHPQETPISAPCTHDQICKFEDPNDNRLEVFEEKLQELVDGAFAERDLVGTLEDGRAMDHSELPWA